jgi:ribose-phosphate pyrophosphokinase
VRIEAEAAGREVLLACTLDRPDDKLVPLLLVANAAREAGATRIGLIAPYLPYMRQDRRFHPGEATSARHFARWISREVDWLVTVDPHLHRIHALDEVYSIPSRVVRAAGVLAEWIGGNVTAPLLIGPDEESAQWVGDVAARLGAPHVVLEKTRRGDRDVTVSVPAPGQWAGRTPVLVDDIVSTAHTMIEAVRGIRACGLAAPVCVAVHGIFADAALEELQRAGAARVVSTDTVRHATSCMSMAGPIAAAVRQLCQ